MQQGFYRCRDQQGCELSRNDSGGKVNYVLRRYEEYKATGISNTQRRTLGEVVLDEEMVISLFGRQTLEYLEDTLIETWRPEHPRNSQKAAGIPNKEEV